jgi:prepilin-type processing-associated H-X9-DG protein
VGFDSGHYAARAWHPGGVNVLFCDGSIRFIRNDINMLVWRAVGTRKGGEPLGDLDGY